MIHRWESEGQVSAKCRPGSAIGGPLRILFRELYFSRLRIEKKMNSTYFSISRANGFSFSGVPLRECEKKGG